MLKKIYHKKNHDRFTALFGGDVSFGENYQEEIKRRGGKSILDYEGYEYGLDKLRPLMTGSDFVTVNLETPVTNLLDSPFKGQKKYLHWTDIEKAPQTLIENNVSLVSLANNHTFDYGTVGYKQTLHILKQHKLPYIGAGDNIEEAARPFILEINFEDKKITVAIIAAFEEISSYRKKYKVYAEEGKAGLMPLELKAISSQVKKIKELDPNAFIILFPHWGDNYRWCDQRQISLSDKLFSEGIDLIIGHGAHMIQEFEKRGRNFVLYNIGNFMFHSPGRYKIKKAPPYSSIVVLNLGIVNNRPNIELKFYPIISDNKITNYQPRLVSKSEFNHLCRLLYQREITETFKKLLKFKHDRCGYYFKFSIK